MDTWSTLFFMIVTFLFSFAAGIGVGHHEGVSDANKELARRPEADLTPRVDLYHNIYWE